MFNGFGVVGGGFIGYGIGKFVFFFGSGSFFFFIDFGL